MQKIAKILRIGSEEHRWCDPYGAQELPPRIIIGAKATLAIDLRCDPSPDDSELPPLPLSQLADVVSWYFALDSDYDQDTIPPFLKTTGISVSQDADGYTILTAAIPDTDTPELRAAIASAETILFKGEIAGLDSSGAIVACFQFPLRMVNRVYLDGEPSSEDAQEHQWLNAAEVRAIIASGAVLQFSSDASSWHAAQTSSDLYLRFRSASSENSAWSPAIALVQGPPGADGQGEDNVIETVQLNGADLAVSNKTVNVQAVTGVTVNGSPVPVSNGVAAITVSGGSGGSGGTITVDSALSSSSTNPVQNKAVYSALADKQDKIDSSHKLPYNYISSAPEIGSGTLTFTSGGAVVAIFNANATSNTTVPLPSGGGASPWAGYTTVETSAASLTIEFGNAYVWTVDASDVDLYINDLYPAASYEIPITIKITSGTVTLHGMTLDAPLIADMCIYGVVVKADGAFTLYIYDMESYAPATPYYTVTGTNQVDGDYYLHSGTHGQQDAVYTNGSYYFFKDIGETTNWGFRADTNPNTESHGPMLYFLYYNETTGAATPPTGTYLQGTGTGAASGTVSAV